jgi:hypothetical protein
LIAYHPSLKAVGGARTGIGPVNLLDVQDVNGNIYHWSDRPINAPVVITGAIAPSFFPALPPVPAGQFQVMAYATNFHCASSDLNLANIHQTYGELLRRTVTGFVLGGGSLYWSTFLPETPIPSGAVIKSITLIFDGYGGGSANNFPTSQYTAISPDIHFLDTITLEAELNTISPPGDCIVKFVGVQILYSIPGEGSPERDYPGVAPYGFGPYVPWLIEVPQFTFHRSQVTDMGAFVLQNLSGDSLSRDFEKILRRSTLEGAFFVYRCWQADAEAAWLEVHGTLTVDPAGVDTVNLKCAQLINAAQDDTPLEIYGETCQLQYGGLRCGATGPTECQYSYQTCQQPNRIMVEANSYEKNYGDTGANTAFNIINRRRTI